MSQATSLNQFVSFNALTLLIGRQKGDPTCKKPGPLWTRDWPKLIFINSSVTETGPKYSNVVSAENKTEAEFNTLFTAETKTENQ